MGLSTLRDRPSGGPINGGASGSAAAAASADSRSNGAGVARGPAASSRIDLRMPSDGDLPGSRSARRDKGPVGWASPPSSGELAVPPGPARLHARPSSRRLSIRWLVIASTILLIIGAMAFSWAITFTFGVRNVQTVSRMLIRTVTYEAVSAVEAYLDEAEHACLTALADFETGRLAQGNWREALEGLHQRVAAVAAPFVDSVRAVFPDGSVLGASRCDDAPVPCSGTTVFTIDGGAGVANSYNATDRGQPLARLYTGPALRTAMERGLLAPGAARLWSDVFSLPMDPTAGGDRLRVELGAPFRVLPPVSSGASYVPPGIPGVPPSGELPGPAAPAAATGPIGGGIIVGIRVPTLSEALARVWEADASLAGLGAGSVALVVDNAGRMVALSAQDQGRLLDAAGSPIPAAASRSEVVRQLVAADPPGGSHAGGVRPIWANGRKYVAAGMALERAPNLRWSVYLAVPEDRIMRDLESSILIVSISNSLWLLAGVACSVAIGVFITRPLADIYKSMTAFLGNLGELTAEMSAHVQRSQRNLQRAPSHATMATSPTSPGPSSREPASPAAAPRTPTVPAPPGPPRASLARRLLGCCRPRRRAVAPDAEGGPGAGGGRYTLTELARFEPVIRDVRAGFLSFSRVVSRETATKMEMKIRSESTQKFLATMSHEMRTPLNGIIGMLELALDCEMGPEAADFVRAALRCGEHLLFLINDVLDYQRIEAGLMQLQHLPFSVADALLGAARMVQLQAQAKGLAIEIELDERIPPLLLGDPDRLRQCLLNLLSNATKYSFEGSVRALARLEPGAGGAVAVYFEVADSGPGIDKESQQQLFTRFFRVPNRRNDRPDPGGSGLGLAITKEIVERAGGSIGCSSEPGVGSRFFFRLPFDLPGEGDLPPGATEAEGADLEPGPRPSSGPRPSLVRPAAPPPTPTPTAATARLESVAGDSVRRGSAVLAGAAGDLAARLSGRFLLGSGPASRPSWANSGPRMSAASAPLGNPRASVASSAGSERSRTPATILVAEDDAVNARIALAMLRNAGHTVQHAADGRAAVEAFRAALDAAPPGALAFDVLFMDCSMPVMSGYEATAAIRALEAARGAPHHTIVALTAHAGWEDETACARAGMDAFLTKPLRKGTLLAKVDEYVRRSSVLASAGNSPLAAPAAARPSLRLPPLGLAELATGSFEGLASPKAPPMPPPPPATPPAPAPAALHEAAAPLPEAALSGAKKHVQLLSLKEAEAPASPAAAAASPAPEPRLERALEVLVVDDVEMNRRVLCAFLAREGHRAAVARDGLEALAAFEGRARGRPPGPVFDLVFMDVAMPKMDGKEATRRIRALERELALPGRTPIVACTAFSSPADREAVAAAGMDGHIAKPVTRALLLPVLRQYGGGGGGGSIRGGFSLPAPPASPSLPEPSGSPVRLL